WRKNFRVIKGAKKITRFEDSENDAARSFCARCGTPLLYEKKRSPHAVNVPRALFAGRTGREPRYHLNFSDRQDWSWTGEKLVPLKAYPGVVWERPRTRKRAKPEEFA
ncbi:MAG TPA: GFA family protein, partial [Rhizomicrobium sp.]